MRNTIVLLLCVVCFAVHAADFDRRIRVGVRERTYLLHVPENPAASAAVVIAFHGAGGQGRRMAQLTRFSELSDREGFIVAYPDGIDRHWHDGQEAVRQGGDVDDLAFVKAMLDDIAATHAVDSHRIYAAGVSNGGMFSYYLALKSSDRIAAIGVVAGGISTALASNFKPSSPVSVMIMHGRIDPVVPYAGGKILAALRDIVPTSTAVRLWTQADGISSAPRREEKPAAKAGDCGEEWQFWSGGRAGTAVTLISFDVGGHAWPGDVAYVPVAVTGNGCPELDATRVLWEFFKQHPKQ